MTSTLGLAFVLWLSFQARVRVAVLYFLPQVKLRSEVNHSQKLKKSALLNSIWLAQTITLVPIGSSKVLSPIGQG